MERTFKIGCRVIFFDSHRVEHEALVTNWFHAGPDGETLDEYIVRNGADPVHPPPADMTASVFLPCCNVVWVTSEKSKEDPYGRQLERASSVSYGRQMGTVPFIGMCWAWPDEIEEARELAAKSFQEAVAK